MSGQVFEEDNNLSWKNCEKFYLDSTNADVNFVFGDGIDSVPAHKIFLTVGSPVFHAMFYGSLPEKGDIRIVDASAEAFKEFLQFFYKNKLRLTSGNIFQVANLCNKYEVNDGLKLCEAPMMRSLTINNMCAGYAVASLFGMEKVVEFCEVEIFEKITEVLKSSDFLDCDHKLLDKILQLVSSKCSPSEIVNACMAWAKAKCERDNIEETPTNLKAQLKHLINRIPFADLDSVQFSRHTKTYKRFFVEDELEEIILTKAKKYEDVLETNLKKHEPKMVATSASGWLFFSRLWRTKDLRESRSIAVSTPITNTNSFTSNTKLQLKQIEVTVKCIEEPADHLKTTITLHNEQSEKSLDLGTVLIKSGVAERVLLPFPVVIDPNVKYSIKCHIDGEHRVWVWKLRNNSKLSNGTEIRFDDEPNMVTHLMFQRIGP